MRLKALQVENFQSLGKVNFEFPDGLVLIDGWDEDLKSHNGVGKSSLLNAITFAIYGKTPKPITLGELLRSGASNMMVSISLESKGQEIYIERSRTEKAGRVRLEINGDRIDGLAKDVEAKIPDIVGLTFEQFVQVVYVFQGDTRRFINLNDTEKKKFLSALLNLSVYDNAYKIAHARLGALELEISKYSGNIESTEKNIGNLVAEAESARKAMESFEEEKKIKVAELSNAVRGVKAAIKDLELQKAQATNSPKLAQLVAKKAEVQQLIDKNTENKQFRDHQIALRAQYLKDIAKLEKQKEQLKDSKCGSCGQALPWDAVQRNYTSVDDEIQNLKEVLPSEEDIEKVKIVDDQKLNGMVMRIMEEIAAEKAQGPDKFDPMIASKKSELKSFATEVQMLDQRAESLQRDIEKASRALEVAREDLQNSRGRLEEAEGKKKYLLEAKKVFSPTGIRAFVFDGIIKELNDRIAFYLDQLSGGSIRFAFDSDDSKGKFTETCEYMGIQRSTAALSGGEFRRLSLATDLALADVVCNRISVYPNILFLDEAFEGLDAIGREAVMDLLTSLIEQKDAIYVVDHASEMKTAFSRTFQLVKRNGETTQDESTQGQ